MRRFEHLFRGLAMAVIAVGISCGGPPVGSKVPRPDPGAVAVGAAAAATALTLANPNLAGQKTNEETDGREPRESKEPRETVPMGVLDRAESADAATDSKQPCKPRETTTGVSLVPGADETTPRTAPKRAPCAESPAPDPSVTPTPRSDSATPR
jgi:hypothetical protein